MHASLIPSAQTSAGAKPRAWRHCLASLLTAALLQWTAAAGGAMPDAPPAPREDVTDVLHGVTISDPYRWLEDGGDARVVAWSAAQDALARTYLDGLPDHARIQRRLMRLTAGASRAFSQLHAAGRRVFALLDQPPRQQPMIAVLGPDLRAKKPHVVLDPNRMDAKGTTAIDWYVPSPDGRLLAVSLSRNGSEDGTLHVYEVDSGREVDAAIPRVQYPTGGGSLAWRSDSRGFWYTRYPGPERPEEEQHFFQQVYFHTLGKPGKDDRYVLGQDFPKVAEILLDSETAPGRVIVSVANGDGGEFAHYVIEHDVVHQLTGFSDEMLACTGGPDGSLYLLSRRDAPRGQILRLAPGDFDLPDAELLVPQSEAVLEGGGEVGGAPLVATHDALYVREMVGGPNRVAVFDLAGKPRGQLELPDPASVDELLRLPDGSLAYSVETYLKPRQFLRFDPRTRKTSRTALGRASPAHFDDAEVIRETAVAPDGTQVPINIIRHRGTVLDHARPVLLNGYGGYAVSLSPRFLGPRYRVWLDGGGVLAIANLRGGGEFGAEWHKDGMLERKQHVFDDFIACAHHLIDDGYTTPARLAILGGSNGGLLMGAVLTQHPELFHAVVSRVGIYDMLRVELDPNGLFNTTEFGTVQNPDQFKALYAYSPYHHVLDGVAYPAVFMATGATDGRVNPAHSRKMTARLQAATTGGPVYLAISSHSGHGIGSALSIRVAQDADWLAFLFDRLGMHF